MDITGFEKIAPHLANSLVLVGFVLLLAYGIHWQLMKSGLLSKVDKKDSGLIIRLFLRYGFWLALATLLAGFGLAGWSKYIDKVQVQQVNIDLLAEKVAAKVLAKLPPSEISREKAKKAVIKAVTALPKTNVPTKDIYSALQELEQGNTAKAKAIFAEVAAAKEAEGKKNNQEAAEAYRNLGTLAYMNNPKDAIVAYQKAVELDPDNAVGLNWLGCLLAITGELEQAEEVYRKVLALGEAHQDKKEQAWAFGNLGLVYETRGELSKAEEMHRKALALNEAVGSEEEMAANYGNLGNVHFRRGEIDNAEQMYRKAFTIAEALGHKEGMAADYSGLGNVYADRGDLDKAEEMYRKSLEIDQALGIKENVAETYGNLGVVYKTRGELAKAEDMYRKSLEISEALGLKETTADQYVNLGILYAKIGYIDQAEEVFRKSLDLYQKMQHPNAKKAQQALNELTQHRANQQAPPTASPRR